jgi:hypothetical protein
LFKEQQPRDGCTTFIVSKRILTALCFCTHIDKLTLVRCAASIKMDSNRTYAGKGRGAAHGAFAKGLACFPAASFPAQLFLTSITLPRGAHPAAHHKRRQ